MTMKPRRAALCLIACAAFSVSARCSSPSVARATDVTVTLVPSSLDVPEALGVARFRATLTKASTRWSHPDVPCTSLTIQVDQAMASRSATADGRNLFVFRRARWCHDQQCGRGSTFPRLAAAMTTRHGAPISGGLANTDADVELNAVRFDWSLDGEPLQPGVRPVAPLLPVLVHEIGHVLGFEDACGSRHGRRAHPDCPPAEAKSVMVSGAARAHLAPWDVERVCARFPKRDAPAKPSPEQSSTAVFLELIAAAVAVGLLVFLWRQRGRA